MSLYVTNQLPEGEAEAFEKHYFGCEHCWNELQRATELRAALAGSGAGAAKPSAEPPAAKIVRGPWTAWRTLAIAAALGLTAAGAILYLRSTRDPTAPLVAAARDRGTSNIEARLSGFPYLPPAPVMRGGESSPEKDPKSRKLWYAAVEAQKKAEEHPTVASLHAAGVAQLLLGHPDEGIQALEKARGIDPRDSRLLSDLSAAYYVRGKQRNDHSDLANALTVATKATELDPHLAPAFFNRAMALEALLPTAASTAWRVYLRIDPDSPWSAEARKHLQALNAQNQSQVWLRQKPVLSEAAVRGDSPTVLRLVNQFPEPAREYAEQELLSDWATLCSRGQTDSASHALIAARTVSYAISEAKGDTFARDTVATIDSAYERRDSADLTATVAGYLDYHKALALVDREPKQALDLFRNAEHRLNYSKSPVRFAAVLGEASAYFYLNQLPKCLKLVDSCLAATDSWHDRYRALRGRANWLRAMALVGQGYPAEALESYESSLQLFASLGEVDNSLAVENLTAETLRYVRDFDAAHAHRDKALLMLPRALQPRWIDLTLGEAAREALADDRADLALLYLDEQVNRALEGGDPLRLSNAYRWRSLGNLRVSRTRPAEEDLHAASLYGTQISNRDIRSRTQADLDIAYAQFLKASNPREAVQRLSNAIAFSTASSKHFRLPGLYLDRGRLYKVLGQDREAIQDFTTGLREISFQREHAGSEDQRIQYFEDAESLVRELVPCLLAAKQPAEAFAVLERARARALLDLLLARRPADPQLPAHFADYQPLGQATVSAALTSRTALVEYLLLPDRLLAWVVRRQGVRIRATPIGERELKSLALQTVGGLQGTDQTKSAAGLTRLYNVLIAPLEADIVDCDRLIVVPDTPLQTIPFAALWDNTKRRYLIEKYAVALEPSALVFLNAARTDLARGRRPSQATILLTTLTSDPRPAAALPPLPGSAAEAFYIARHFRNVTALADKQATKARFLAAAAKSTVVHFAGHALVSPVRSRFSRLLLSPDKSTNDSGYLYAHEIVGADFPQTRLVVLAACETAAGPTAANEGALSLARAFLAARIPGVVATLWPVDDQFATVFTEQLYLQLRKGRSALDATRLAYLALLQDSDIRINHPAAWAPFVFMGASSGALFEEGS